jgi:hypothetical protein
MLRCCLSSQPLRHPKINSIRRGRGDRLLVRPENAMQARIASVVAPHYRELATQFDGRTSSSSATAIEFATHVAIVNVRPIDPENNPSYAAQQAAKNDSRGMSY